MNSLHCCECGRDIQRNEDNVFCSSCGRPMCVTCREKIMQGIIVCSKCKQKAKEEQLKTSQILNQPSLVPSGGLLATCAHLVDVRVIQRDLVYVVGLPVKYANEDTLLKYEFFGQYGPIKKVVVNSTHVHSSSNQALSVSAYVTFRNNEDATECIYSLESFSIEGSQMKASFGTTKYCSAFLKGQKCTNPDCMYLHQCGDPGDSFSKDEITGSCCRFVEMTRPSRPPDYNEYPKQDARPTVLPPRRLMKKESSPKKGLGFSIISHDGNGSGMLSAHAANSGSKASSIIPFQILLSDSLDNSSIYIEELDDEDVSVEAQTPPVSVSKQLRIRKTPFRTIYNTISMPQK